MPGFRTISVIVHDNDTATLDLARPSKSNAVDLDMWDELPLALEYLDQRDDVRVILLSGQGKNFCSGIDFSALSSISSTVNAPCPGRAREALRRHILRWQDSISAIEKCRWPVIAAVQGACFGAGLDIIAAADIRYCSTDAYFCVKEVDIAITADMGVLQRLPGLIGQGRARELALTARVFKAQEAKAIGLVTEVFPDAAALHVAAASTAASIAAKSPLAITGTKRVLLHSRDHSVAEGLKYVATWNSAQMPSQDLEAVTKNLLSKSKQPPRFSKL